ncbi:MAG: hypothetical protein E6I65_08100 [Chloroflexi bacterium]|nr:MAG: hypothetical protein E6I65_08100 [Chloroflexota bacterium]
MDHQTSTNPAAPEGGYLAGPVPLEPAPAGVATAATLPALSRSALLTRIGLLGIGAAALVAAAILVFGSTASPNGTLAAGTTNGTTGGTTDLLNGGGPGFRGGHLGMGGITITAINGNDISLKTVDGWTRTITVDSGTTYSKSGATIALGDLKVGDEIGFRQTHETSGTWTIDSIVVILPHAGGEVTKVAGSTITVTAPDGTTATITVNAQTTYDVNGATAKLADVKVGMFLIAEGTKNGDGSLTATKVRAADASTFRGDHGGPGFGFRFGPDDNGTTPNATAAPSATGTAS